MANVNEAHAIAARVKRVPGWKATQVRSLSGAYKVTAPNGKVIQIHNTASDNNWHHSVWRAINAEGFEADEQRWKEAEERDKKARNDRARAEAERKAQDIARRAALLQKVRGPYAQPEEVPLSWFIEPHPAPWHRWVLMSPELAGELMESINTDNRQRRKHTVEHYRNVILSGQWHLTHQGMAIDQRGILQDGQHRLAAIRESGVTVPVSFYVGMPTENFKAIDEGLLRRAADLVGKAGESYAAMTAAMVKLIDAYDSTDPRKAYHTKKTNETVWDLLKLDEENIRSAVRFGSSNYKKPKLNGTGMAGAYYLIRKKNGPDNPYVEAFFSGLINGFKGESRVMLDDDDPRTRLRELMINFRDKGKRVNALDCCALIIMAWNFTVQDHRPRFLRLADNMELPPPDKCATEGRWASACPSVLVGEIGTAVRTLQPVA